MASNNSNDKKFDNGRGLRVLLPIVTQKGTMEGALATSRTAVTRDIPHLTVHDLPSIAMVFCRLKPGHRNCVISKLYLFHLYYNKKPTIKHSAQNMGWGKPQLIRQLEGLSWWSRYAGQVHWIALSLSSKKDSFCTLLRTRREPQCGASHSILYQKVPPLI